MGLTAAHQRSVSDMIQIKKPTKTIGECKHVQTKNRKS